MSTTTLLPFDPDFLKHVDDQVRESSKNVKRTHPQAKEWVSTDAGNYAAVSIAHDPANLNDRATIALRPHKNHRGELVNKGLAPYLRCTEQDAKTAAQDIIKHINGKD